MDFLRRYWTQIQAQLAQLAGANLTVVVLVVVTLALVLWLLLSYVGKPEYATLAQLSGDQQVQAVSRLKAEGLAVQISGQQILVPADKRMEAMAILAQNELLGTNASSVFDELVKNQTPWATNQQNEQASLYAKQKFLAQVIAKMKGVRSADVIVSLPQKVGFGSTYNRPSASVNVVMRGGAVLDRGLVKAIASWVSGAVAEMRPQDVSVVDANSGRTLSVPAEDDSAPTETLELVHQLERDYREKILGALAYIPNVLVSVNVRVDPTLKVQTQKTEYEKTEPVRRERADESQTRTASAGAEPGVRSNTALEISGGGGASTLTTTSNTETEYGEKKPVVNTQSTAVGGLAQRVSVTVNVPRGYFVQVYQRQNPQAKDEPDAAALQPVVDVQLAQIKAQVEPLVAAESAGMVAVHMIPDVVPWGGVGGGGATGTAMAGGSSMGLPIMEAAWLKPLGLSLLAAGSVAMMLWMVRKSTQRPPMPSAEELAGVPPPLPIDDELVGEAEATDATMPGIELDEQEMQQRKMAEQIGEMIRANPAEAAGLFSKWVKVQE